MTIAQINAFQQQLSDVYAWQWQVPIAGAVRTLEGRRRHILKPMAKTGAPWPVVNNGCAGQSGTTT